MLLHDALIVALVGGFLSLDDLVIGRFMLSMPLITGPIVGWFLGRPDIGLAVGCLWQLMWSGALPIGVNVPPNSMMQGVLASGFSVLLAKAIGNAPIEPIVIFSLLVTLPISFLGGVMDLYFRKKNVYFVRFAEVSVEMGRPIGIAGAVWLSVIITFLRNAVFFFLCIYGLSSIFSEIFMYLPDHVLEGFHTAYYLVPGIGLAIVFDLFNSRPQLVYFLVPILLTIVLLYFQVGVATLLSVSVLCGLLVGMWRFLMALRFVK